jgi:hypothetical protein
MHWSIVSVIAAVGIAALWGAWWLWWRLPKRQVDRLRLTIRDPKARADVEDNFRKTIGQLLGGATVLIGAALAYLQFSQQQQASHDLLISNQVSKGFEQLGSDTILVRLGGIYALEGVMNTSEQYHQPVLEALSAFVRDGTKTAPGNGAPATDIQAALTVIGRRVPVGTGVPDLTAAHILNANPFGRRPQRRRPRRRQPQRRQPRPRQPQRRPPQPRRPRRRLPRRRQPRRRLPRRRQPQPRLPRRRQPQWRLPRWREPDPESVGQSLRHGYEAAAAGPDPE